MSLGTENCCFLVSGDDLRKQNSKFIEFLRSEGFQGRSCFWNCSWVWVNIESKAFARGMPGVKFANAIGNHAITIEEFLIIYNIFKPYDGLAVLQFEGNN